MLRPDIDNHDLIKPGHWRIRPVWTSGVDVGIELCKVVRGKLQRRDVFVRLGKGQSEVTYVDDLSPAHN